MVYGTRWMRVGGRKEGGGGELQVERGDERKWMRNG
jgi:hypothetical protein